AKNLEYIIINLTYHAFNSKKKNRADARLAQVFASSLTFINSEPEKFDGSYRKKMIGRYGRTENRYFMDVACLTVWEDKSLEYRESEFIFGIGKDLGMEISAIQETLKDVAVFFDLNASRVPHLRNNNLAVQFYDSMSKVV